MCFLLMQFLESKKFIPPDLIPRNLYCTDSMNDPHYEHHNFGYKREEIVLAIFIHLCLGAGLNAAIVSKDNSDISLLVHSAVHNLLN
jgi:hypothetical protein